MGAMYVTIRSRNEKCSKKRWSLTVLVLEKFWLFCWGGGSGPLRKSFSWNVTHLQANQ